MEWMGGSHDVVLSIGNTQITGKDCICESMTVNIDNDLDGFERGIVTIDLTLLCHTTNFTQMFWDKNYKPKIRNKKVNDCSIQELLFAIRSKAKLKNNLKK